MADPDSEEQFIRLVQLFRDDKDMQNALRSLSNKSDIERNSILTSISLKMKNDKNLSSLADAVFLLNDKYLFEKLMNYVTKKQDYQSE